MNSAVIRVIGGLAVSTALTLGVNMIDTLGEVNTDVGTQTQVDAFIETQSETQDNAVLGLNTDALLTTNLGANVSLSPASAQGDTNVGVQAQAQAQTTPAATSTPTPVPATVTPSPTPAPAALNTPAPTPTPASQPNANTQTNSQAQATVDVKLPSVNVSLGNNLGITLGL